MTTLTIYERNNTIKTSITYKSGSTLTDPSGNKAFVNIIKPDGTYLAGNGSGATTSRDGTGSFHYYFTPADTDPLGIWTIEWFCRSILENEHEESYYYPKIVQRTNIHIVNVDE